MDIDFNQARSKHTFFRTRVRIFLLGSEADPVGFKAYLRGLDAWVEDLATRYLLSSGEGMKANFLHNELFDLTEALIRLWNAGQGDGARRKFQEIESTGREFLDILSRLEHKTR